MKKYDEEGLARRLESRIAEAKRLIADVRSAPAAAASKPPAQERIESAITAQQEQMSNALARIEARLERLEASATSVAMRGGAYHPTIYGGQNLNATLIDGLLVGVPAEELRLALYHAFYGFQEPGVLSVFNAMLRPGAVVVDAGACIGVFTLYAARAVGTGGKVYAFEPTPRTFHVLSENLKFNGFSDTGVVDARQIALSDRNGTASISHYEGDFGLNTLYARPAMAPQEISVEVMRLDDALAGVTHVDVVKIDVEGAERAVITGMPRLIEANPELAIVMEFAPVHLRRANVDPGPFARELIDRGFTLQLIDDITGSLQPIDVRTLVERRNSNVLARRPAAAQA